MTGKMEPSLNEDTFVKKSPAWVFDERTGWIDVNEFLSRTSKLSEDLAKKISDHKKG